MVAGDQRRDREELEIMTSLSGVILLFTKLPIAFLGSGIWIIIGWAFLGGGGALGICGYDREKAEASIIGDQ